jgi:hypothetical protein
MPLSCRAWRDRDSERERRCLLDADEEQGWEAGGSSGWRVLEREVRVCLWPVMAGWAWVMTVGAL